VFTLCSALFFNQIQTGFHTVFNRLLKTVWKPLFYGETFANLSPEQVFSYTFFRSYTATYTDKARNGIKFLVKIIETRINL
jgi:hypothetical protein